MSISVKKNVMYVKKIKFGILLHAVVKMEKYLASTMDDSAIIYDEVKTTLKNFDKKKPICKTQNLYILLTFLSITVALLIVVSIYCYLIKY